MGRGDGANGTSETEPPLVAWLLEAGHDVAALSYVSRRGRTTPRFAAVWIQAIRATLTVSVSAAALSAAGQQQSAADTPQRLFANLHIRGHASIAPEGATRELVPVPGPGGAVATTYPLYDILRLPRIGARALQAKACDVVLSLTAGAPLGAAAAVLLAQYCAAGVRILARHPRATAQRRNAPPLSKCNPPSPPPPDAADDYPRKGVAGYCGCGDAACKKCATGGCSGAGKLRAVAGAFSCRCSLCALGGGAAATMCLAVHPLAAVGVGDGDVVKPPPAGGGMGKADVGVSSAVGLSSFLPAPLWCGASSVATPVALSPPTHPHSDGRIRVARAAGRPRKAEPPRLVPLNPMGLGVSKSAACLPSSLLPPPFAPPAVAEPPAADAAASTAEDVAAAAAKSRAMTSSATASVGAMSAGLGGGGSPPGVNSEADLAWGASHRWGGMGASWAWQDEAPPTPASVGPEIAACGGDGPAAFAPPPSPGDGRGGGASCGSLCVPHPPSPLLRGVAGARTPSPLWEGGVGGLSEGAWSNERRCAAWRDAARPHAADFRGGSASGPSASSPHPPPAGARPASGASRAQTPPSWGGDGGMMSPCSPATSCAGGGGWEVEAGAAM